MPHFDSHIFKKKGERKSLILAFDEGDDVLGSVKVAMMEHQIKDARVDDAQGSLLGATVNFMQGSRYKVKDLKDVPLIAASGNFKQSFGELFGTLHVTYGRPPETATFVKGRAAAGMQLKLSFVHINE